jgi:hypothetical protein
MENLRHLGIVVCLGQSFAGNIAAIDANIIVVALGGQVCVALADLHGSRSTIENLLDVTWMVGVVYLHALPLGANHALHARVVAVQVFGVYAHTPGRNEQMFSGVAPTTDITLAFDPSRTPPVTDNYFTWRRP